MRKIAWLIILGVLGYLGYSYYLKSNSPEVKLVRNLEKEFHRAEASYLTAMRQAAEPGLVILSDRETAENQVKEVRKRVQGLTRKLSDERAIARAKELEAEIKTFCARNQID